MHNWYTVEQIDDMTYIISEYGHPQEVHSFLLLGEHSACLIDTGLGIWDIKEITDELTDLPVKVITTHAHFDHIGSHGSFYEIYIHQKEADWLRKGLPMQLETIRGYVLEAPVTKPFPVDFDINNYFPYTGDNIHELEDGDVIDPGLRPLRIIHTPGHSPGHICVVDETRGYLFTGDLLYKGALYAFLPESDPYLYKNSIEKICNLEKIDRILPSHNDISISKHFIREVAGAFAGMEKEGILRKGAGIIKYNDFSIFL